MDRAAIAGLLFIGFMAAAVLAEGAARSRTFRQRTFIIVVGLVTLLLVSFVLSGMLT